MKSKKPTQFMRGYTAQEMTQIHMGSVRKGGPSILGTARQQMEIDVEIDFKRDNYAGNTLSCIALNKVVVNFIALPAIMIADDFRKGTCEYKAVLDHEKEHVAATLKFQDHYAPKLKRAVKKILHRYGQPQVSSRINSKHAMLTMEKNIHQAIVQYFWQIYPTLNERQAEIDSAESYARVFQKCSGWARAMAPKRKRRYR